MRTRAKFEMNSIAWLLLAITQVALIYSRMQRHAFAHRTSWLVLDEIALVLWLAIAVPHLSQIFFNFWQVDADGIAYRRLWFTRKIPFSTIVAVRQKDYTTGKPINGIEIEIARRGPTVYPHQYLIAKPGNREGFLKAIAAFAPQTAIEE
jgi:hypothetical protein